MTKTDTLARRRISASSPNLQLSGVPRSAIDIGVGIATAIHPGRDPKHAIQSTLLFDGTFDGISMPSRRRVSHSCGFLVQIRFRLRHQEQKTHYATKAAFSCCHRRGRLFFRLYKTQYEAIDTEILLPFAKIYQWIYQNGGSS